MRTKRNERICPDQEMPCRTCSPTSSVTSFFCSEGGKGGHICVQRKQQQHLEASTQANQLYAHHASLSRGASLLSQLGRGGAKVFKIFKSANFLINILNTDTSGRMNIPRGNCIHLGEYPSDKHKLHILSLGLQVISSTGENLQNFLSLRF